MNEIGVRDRVLKQNDLYEILPFGKTKVEQLLMSGQLPVVKIGRDYVTTFDNIQLWLRENQGKEILF